MAFPLLFLNALGEIMEKRNIHKLLQIGLIIIALGSMVGCGSSKTGDGFGSADESSTDQTQINVPAGTAMAACSEDVEGLSDLKVRLMVYQDSYGKVRPDYVRLQINKAPSGWQSGNWDLYIYRWTAASDGNTSIDSTPLQYQWERKVGSGFSLMASTWYQVFNWAEVVQMVDYVKESAQVDLPKDSPQAFANVASLLVGLKDTTNSYQVLRLVFKNGNTVMKEANVLIPTFIANPEKYNADPRHPPILQTLHPLKSRLGQTWTEANYLEFARSFCF